MAGCSPGRLQTLGEGTAAHGASMYRQTSGKHACCMASVMNQCQCTASRAAWPVEPAYATWLPGNLVQAPVLPSNLHWSTFIPLQVEVPAPFSTALPSPAMCCLAVGDSACKRSAVLGSSPCRCLCFKSSNTANTLLLTSQFCSCRPGSAA